MRVVWQGEGPEGTGALVWPDGEAPSLSAQRARQWLSSRGYFWSDEHTSHDTLWVCAGPRAQVGRVHAGPDTMVTAPCLTRFREALDERFDAATLRQALSGLVEELVSRGRPYTQVRLLALDVSNPPTVDLELAVYSGPEVYAGALVTGAARTHARVFEREAGWRRGALLESDLISESEETLSALPYVASLDTAMLLAVTLDTADLYLGVKEAPGVRAGGLLGWVPSSGATRGYWAGEFELQLRSAFGDGRNIGLLAARPDPTSRRTRVYYREPWPWGAPFWLGLDFAQEDFASDYIESKAALSVRLAAGDPRWQFEATWGRVTLEESPSTETYPADYLKAGIAVMDSSLSSAYRFEFDWSTQHLHARDSTRPPQERIQFTQGRFDAHRWWSVSRSVHTKAVLAGAGTLLGSGNIPQHLLYRVGGLQSLRGYREQQFAVRDVLRLGWEWHLGSRQQSLFAFADAAWLNFQSAPSRLLASAGLGIRVAHRVSLLAGIPSEGGLAEMKIHLGISTGR